MRKVYFLAYTIQNSSLQLDNNGKRQEPVAQLEPAHEQVDDIVNALNVEKEHADNVMIAAVNSAKAAWSSKYGSDYFVWLARDILD